MGFWGGGVNLRNHALTQEASGHSLGYEGDFNLSGATQHPLPGSVSTPGAPALTAHNKQNHIPFPGSGTSPWGHESSAPVGKWGFLCRAPRS